MKNQLIILGFLILGGACTTSNRRPDELFYQRNPKASLYTLYETTPFQLKLDAEECINYGIYSYLRMRDAFSTNADLVGYANARITSLRKAQRLKMEYWDTVRRTMEVGSRLFLYTYNDTKSQKTETGVFVLDANGNIVKRLEVMTSESSSMSKQIEKVE